MNREAHFTRAAGFLVATLMLGGAVTAFAQTPERDRDRADRDRDKDRAGQIDRTRDQDPTTDRKYDYAGNFDSDRCHNIIGADVKNTGGQDIGEIQDLAIDIESGRVAYAVLSFGGFLGMGDKHFAIPWTAMTFQPNDTIQLDIDKTTLEESEGFDKDSWPDMANDRWARTTHERFGQRPYWEEDRQTRQSQNRRIVAASKIRGTRVDNAQGDKVADVKDLVIDKGQGRIAYAVLGVGGFLNIGEDHVAVPWQKLNVNVEGKKKPKLQVNATEDQLTRGPKFTDKNWPAPDDKVMVVRVHSFYQVDPYWDSNQMDNRNRMDDSRNRNRDRDEPRRP